VIVLDTLPCFAAARVLVVGDTILDRYVIGRIERISREAPVPVLLHETTREMLGGAGNVAANIASLGGQVDLIGLLGEDADGARVRALLAKRGIADTALLSNREGRSTSVNTRFLAQGQQVLRHDWEVAALVSEVERDALLDAYETRLAAADVVVLSDYGKGAAKPPMSAAIIERARAAGKRVVVDPRDTDFSVYAGANAITPNRQELAAATGLVIGDDASIEAAGAHLIASCGLEALIATRSEDGLSVIRSDTPPVHIPTQAREVFDVSGAGDTVVAALALGLAVGLTWPKAAALANAAASVVVGKRGTAQVTPDELRAGGGSALEGRMTSWKEAATAVRCWQQAGLVVGFTNGCFDLVHPGHVSLLAFARRNCDRLVVGVNEDASVRRLKGPSRPVHDVAARATVLAALKSVDLVVGFGEDTPLALIQALQPDVLVKGADYTVETVVGADVVLARGGRVLLAPLINGQSTTDTIARMNDKHR